MNQQTILVVDDDQDIREGIRILLASESYCIIEAENGQEKCQEVYHHLVSAASKAKADLDRCGLGNSAYLAGLLHDMGKGSLLVRQ